MDDLGVPLFQETTTCYQMLQWCFHLAKKKTGFRSSFSPLELRYLDLSRNKTLWRVKDCGDPRRFSWTQGEHTIRILSIEQCSKSLYHSILLVGLYGFPRGIVIFPNILGIVQSLLITNQLVFWTLLHSQIFAKDLSVITSHSFGT